MSYSMMTSAEGTEQYYPNWLNMHYSFPQEPLFPSVPGSAHFIFPGYNDGVFVPPPYNSKPSPFQMQYYPNWHCMPSSVPQEPPFPMLQGPAFFTPHGYNSEVFTPPEYSRFPPPFYMQHWSYLPTGQQDWKPNNMLGQYSAEPCMTDFQDSYNSKETVEHELVPTPTSIQSIPTQREDQLTVKSMIVTEDNSNTNTKKVAFAPGRRSKKKARRTRLLSKRPTQPQDAELIIWETEVPQYLVRELVGEGGRYLKTVRQRCGGLVYMSAHPRTLEYLLCNIMGTQSQVDKALDLIKKRVKHLDLKNIYMPPALTFGNTQNLALQRRGVAAGSEDRSHQSEDVVSGKDALQVAPSRGVSERKKSLRPLSGVLRSSEGRGRLQCSWADVCRGSRTLTHDRTGGDKGREMESHYSIAADVNSLESGASQPSDQHNTEQLIWEIKVPNRLAGMFLRKNGRYLEFVKKRSGALAYMSPLPQTWTHQVCSIEGTKDQVDKALMLIKKKAKDLDLTNIYVPTPLPSGNS